MKRGDLDRGELLLTQALAQAPDSAGIQYNLTYVELLHGNIKKARERLQALTQQHPQYAFALCQLALIEMANDRLEEARELLKRAFMLEHFHFDEFTIFCKAQILFSLVGQSDYASAKQWWDTWEDFVPDDPQLEMMRPVMISSPFARLRATQMLASLRE